MYFFVSIILPVVPIHTIKNIDYQKFHISSIATKKINCFLSKSTSWAQVTMFSKRQTCNQNINFIDFHNHLNQCMIYHQRSVSPDKQATYIPSHKLKKEAVENLWTNNFRLSQFFYVDNMRFDLQSHLDISFEVVENTDIEMVTYTDNAKREPLLTLTIHCINLPWKNIGKLWSLMKLF